MITALPSGFFVTIIRFPLMMAMFQLISIAGVQGQSNANLLVNGSFESPAVSGYNTNHIIGPGLPWGGWNCTNGGLNILRMSGSGYSSGANHADDGDQYMDVANTDGYISQQFVLDYISPLFFSGAFSSRESNRSGYVSWTALIEILDSTGTVVASSSTRNFVTTDNQELWYTMTGTTINLQPGTYTYRAYAGNWGHFDNAIVAALNPVLSVKLLNFNTSIQGTQVLATWNVSTEQKLKGYELQWGIDGVIFHAAGFVAAGNKDQYSLSHKHPSSGTLYYRLKVTDLDGTFFYSRTNTITFDPGKSLTLYPNPATNSICLGVDHNMTGRPATLMITAGSGQIMLHKSFARLDQVIRVDVSTFIPGTYYMKLVAESETITKPFQVIGK